MTEEKLLLSNYCLFTPKIFEIRYDYLLFFSVSFFIVSKLRTVQQTISCAKLRDAAADIQISWVDWKHLITIKYYGSLFAKSTIFNIKQLLSVTRKYLIVSSSSSSNGFHLSSTDGLLHRQCLIYFDAFAILNKVNYISNILNCYPCSSFIEFEKPIK